MVLLHLRIIIIKKEEAFPVFFPKPAIAKSNIEGHMIDKNKPPDMKKNFAISVSVQTSPATIINKPDIPKKFSSIFPNKTTQ
jgi:hypothetical protein